MAVGIPTPRLALLAAWAATAVQGRACSLWQIIDAESSRFNVVHGNLNGYELTLRGDLQPTVRGKILQTFDGSCPTSMSALQSVGFTLSTSESEPILVDYAEVKVGPAKISLTDLRGAMESHHFDASFASCGPDENFGGPCFAGTVRMRALTGNAHVLGHNLNLAGMTGDIDVRGYLDPGDSELRLQLTSMHIKYMIDTAEAHGPFELTGFLVATAQLPFTFSMDLLRAESAQGPSSRARLGSAALGAIACAAILLAVGARVARRRRHGAAGASGAAEPSRASPGDDAEKARWSELL